MKKFLLISVCAFAFNLNAVNMVPVLSSITEDKQNDVYSVILHNSLPTAAHPEYRASLSERDIDQIIENPYGFLINKIQEVCPAAKVQYIPKSLWQLFGYYHMLKTLVDTPTMESLDFYFPRRGTDKSIVFLQTGHCPDLYRHIKAYNENVNVKNAFWKVNALILEYWRDDLETFTDTLLNMTIDEAQKLLKPSSSDTDESARVKEICRGGFGICQPISCLRANKGMIKQLIMNEARARGYTIIRSEAPIPDPCKIAERKDCSSACLSFSDGICAGWVRDFGNGSALGFAACNRNRVMISIELPARTMFDDQWFWIPPVILLGAVMGYGEFHHVRTLASLVVKNPNGFETSGISDVAKETYPMFFGKNCNIWPQLRFIEKIEFGAPIKTLSTYVLEATKTYDQETAEEPLPVAPATVVATSSVDDVSSDMTTGKRSAQFGALEAFEKGRKRKRPTLTSEQQQLIDQALNYDNEELAVLTTQLVEEWNEQTATQLREKMKALDDEAIKRAQQ